LEVVEGKIQTGLDRGGFTSSETERGVDRTLLTRVDNKEKKQPIWEGQVHTNGEKRRLGGSYSSGGEQTRTEVVDQEMKGGGVA